MILQKANRKIIAYSLVALTISIGVLHYWQPITISPTDAGERFDFSLLVIVSACLIPFGNRAARIIIGTTFLFLTLVNSLIILAYVRDLSLNSLGIGFLTFVLGFLGYSLLAWKSARVFEEEREKKQLSVS